MREKAVQDTHPSAASPAAAPSTPRLDLAQLFCPSMSETLYLPRLNSEIAK